MQSNAFSESFVGQNVITVPEVDSTNDYLKSELTKSKPLMEGTVIMAVHQFAGKGQKQAVWHSEPGKNLTCSLFLRPNFLQPSEQFDLSVAISLAMAKCMEEILGNPVSIKWPNDILVDGRKLAGLLIENSWFGSEWKSAVVGIGINVNQRQFPVELAEKVTSIIILQKENIEVSEVLCQLCQHIDFEYKRLMRRENELQRQEYVDRLYLVNEHHMYAVGGVCLSGRILGVSSQGKLIVDFGGQSKEFDIKEISYECP